RTIHVTQVHSKYNTDPAAGNRDCGPASVVMALGLLGKKIPGIVGHAPQRSIQRIRQLAGVASESMSTTNLDLEKALSKAGVATDEVDSIQAVHDAIVAGHPVILNGNPRNPGAYGPKFSASQMVPYNGAHWICVSGVDENTGQYIINDPLSKIGPVKVSPAQL